MREAELSRNETKAEGTAPTPVDWVCGGSKGTEADGTESGGEAEGKGKNCTSLYNYETNYEQKRQKNSNGRFSAKYDRYDNLVRNETCTAKRKKRQNTEHSLSFFTQNSF